MGYLDLKVIFTEVFPLEKSALFPGNTPNHMQNQKYHCKKKQQVNQQTCHMKNHESANPKQQQHHENC
jgi:hypothetical protein